MGVSISSMVIIFLLSVVGIRCDANSMATEREIEQLKSKVASLESKCVDQEKEMKEKDERLSFLDKSIQQKSTQVASLASEIELLQKRSIDGDEMVHKADAHNYLLEKHIEELQIELETQIGTREALEAKAREAEKTAEELDQKLESVAKINDKQRLKIQQLDRDLNNAQNEIGKVQARANLNAEELEKEHGAWLPHWLVSRILRFKEILSINWNKLVRPALEVFLRGIVETLTQFKELIGPHMELASNKFVPHGQTAYSKTSDLYGVCVDAITPHSIKVRQTMQSYLQKVKKPFWSCIALVKAATEPHATKVRVFYEPYKKHIVFTFVKIIDVLVMYHRQVQAVAYKILRKHELLRPLATENITWFLASSLFFLPLIILYTVVSSIFWRKRRRRNRGTSHKLRRRRVEK